MKSFLEEIKDYFKTTPPEQIKAAWKETAEFDDIGISVDEYLELYRFEQPITFESNIKLTETTTKMKQTELFEKLEAYFEETPIEKIREAWEKTAEHGYCGITVQEILDMKKPHVEKLEKIDKIIPQYITRD